MAYPSRPPMVPGISMPTVVGTPFSLRPNLVPAVGIQMTQSISSIPTPLAHPPMHASSHLSAAAHALSSATISKPPSISKRPDGPPVTVFVGNITERAPDVMIRHILNTCGQVMSWKRVQDASGKLKAFGFCEFANPDSALRAIRLLHSYEIADKKLVVKADAKFKQVLDEYKARRKKIRENGDKSPLQDEKETDTDDDYLDDEMRAEDIAVQEKIGSILADHRREIISYIAPSRERMSEENDRLTALSNISDISNIPSSANLDSMDYVEEGKKELISREITMFRESMKKQEEEKERDRRQREKERDYRDRDREREHSRDKEREWERERYDKENSHRSKSRSKSELRYSRSPSETRKIRRERKRTRSRSPSQAKKGNRDLYKEKELEAEERERKEQERKARKKELQYQERLRNWEAREAKKQKELDKECEREKLREIEKEREARRLKEFLEDYDDDRDDPKYYKGHAFQRKLMEREREKDLDNKDRAKEKEELEALKAKIFSEGHANPDEAYKKACEEMEERYKPKLLIKPQVNNVAKSPSPELVPILEKAERTPLQSLPTEENMDQEVEDSDNHVSPPPPVIKEEIQQNKDIATPDPPIHLGKKKKLDIKDVFNQDEDDVPVKKKKLPLPGKEKAKEKGGEEKRKHIKSLIDKIPTSKEELFAFPIDSSLVDSVLMEKRIRPWINKKIVEYIGEPEPTLVEFICSKVLIGSGPQDLLNDVQMVLDDEAEVFVVKMWRLLIYEIEAKKLGLGKS